MHHELPDILIPYKRHCTETVECIVEEEVISVCCEVSTIKKISDWFRGRARYFFGCIESIFADRGCKPDNSSVSLLHRIKNIIGGRPWWLKRLVRIVVNSNLWVHTRSEYLPD
jgi:hypothetical protein